MTCGSGVSMGVASLLKFQGSQWDSHLEIGPKETRRVCEQCILPLHVCKSFALHGPLPQQQQPPAARGALQPRRAGRGSHRPLAAGGAASPAGTPPAWRAAPRAPVRNMHVSGLHTSCLRSPAVAHSAFPFRLGAQQALRRAPLQHMHCAQRLALDCLSLPPQHVMCGHPQLRMLAALLRPLNCPSRT